MPQGRGAESAISEQIQKSKDRFPPIRHPSDFFDLAKGMEEKRISKDEARTILKDVLMHDNQQVRWSAVHMLGKLGLDTLPELRCALGNDNDTVRSMAAAMVYALMRENRPRPFHPNPLMEGLVNDLIDCLQSQDRPLVDYSASALNEIAKRDPVSTLLVLPERIPYEGWVVSSRLMLIEKVAESALELEKGRLG